MQENNEPKGVGFIDLKSGDTLYAKLEPQIQGFINSSDMGINASRGQDFKWRLAPEWVQKVKDFRKNETKMEVLTNRNGGQRPTTTQILYAIYGEQLRVAQELREEGEAPYEEKYLQDISDKSAPADVANDEEVDEETDSEQLEPAKAAKAPKK
jgi:hypothetical protein